MQKLLTDDDYDYKKEEESGEHMVSEDENTRFSVFEDMQQLLNRKQELKKQYRNDPEIQKNKRKKNRGLI